MLTGEMWDKLMIYMFYEFCDMFSRDNMLITAGLM